MRTEAQREAARLNGAKSRGPRTPEGKARSSQNSLRHGCYSRSGSPETEAGLRELYTLLGQYPVPPQPESSLEQHLCALAEWTSWRISQVNAFETRLLDAEIERQSLLHPELAERPMLAVFAFARLHEETRLLHTTARLDEFLNRQLLHLSARLLRLSSSGSENIKTIRNEPGPPPSPQKEKNPPERTRAVGASHAPQRIAEQFSPMAEEVRDDGASSDFASPGPLDQFRMTFRCNEEPSGRESIQSTRITGCGLDADHRRACRGTAGS